MSYLLILLLLLLFLSIIYRPRWWYQTYRYMLLLSNIISFYTVYQAPSLHTITRSRKELKNIPTHIAMIFNETYYRSKSIAELLNWCYILKIQTATIYSEEGIEEKMRNEILRDLSIVFSGQITQDRNKAIMQKLEIGVPDMEERNLEIIFIDRMNGKPAIAKVATNCMSNHKKELSVEEFEEKVLLESEFKPPELAIIFGPAFSTCDYPPWHLQFTEMYHFQTHRYIHWRPLLDVFTSFAKTKQNYGK